MTFEEEFPSLKGEGLCNLDTNCLNGTDNAFLAKDIQEHCLDKKKVKEAIDNFWFGEEHYNEEDMNKFKKELGLM